MLPIRRVFRSLYKTKYGSLLLTYKQATIEEQNLFFKKDISSVAWFYEFCLNNGTYSGITLKHRLLKKYYYEKMMLVLIENIEDICKDIFSNMFRRYESIYEGIDMSYTDKPASRKTIDGVDIIDVVKEFSINGPIELIENYTYEQYERMIDRILFKNLESDYNSRIVNDRALSGSLSLTNESIDLLSIIKQQQEVGLMDHKAEAQFTIETYQ